MPLLVLAADPPIAVAAGLLGLAGVGFAYQLGIQRRFLIAVPEDMRGHAFALSSTGLMSVQGIAPVAFGLLAEVLPVGPAMAVAGVALLLTAAAVGRWLRQRGTRPGQDRRSGYGCESGIIPVCLKAREEPDVRTRLFRGGRRLRA